MKVLHYWSESLTGTYNIAQKYDREKKKHVMWKDTLDKSIFVLVNFDLTKGKKIKADHWKAVQLTNTVGEIPGLPRISKATGSKYVQASTNPLWHTGDAEVIGGEEEMQQTRAGEDEEGKFSKKLTAQPATFKTKEDLKRRMRMRKGKEKLATMSRRQKIMRRRMKGMEENWVR